jgi:uncharacterized protein (DUF3084 family)
MALFETDIGSLFPQEDRVEQLQAEVTELAYNVDKLVSVIESLVDSHKELQSRNIQLQFAVNGLKARMQEQEQE